MRWAWMAVALVALAAPASASAERRYEAGPAQYGVTSPVVLSLTPYAKDVPPLSGALAPDAADLVPHGYVFVAVDVRGTGSSGGAFELLGPRERRDSVEVVDWAARLP